MPKVIKFLFLIILGLNFFVTLPVHAALIGYWKFDDGSGTSTIDSSGNSVTGTFSGTTQPTWSTDVPSVSFSDPYSLSFVGDGDGVLFNWPSNLNMNATDTRSFSFWFKPTAAGESSGNYSRLVSWSNDKFEIAGSDASYTNNKLSFYDGVSWRSTNYTMSLNTWYHITFTFDGSIEHLYIDNTEQFSTTTTNNALSGVLGIGTRVNNTPHNEGVNGLIDDVRVYSTALTATQISNLTSGSSNPDTPPDTTAPVFSNISATSTVSTTASITWTTDEAASSKVLYGLTSSYSTTTIESDTTNRTTTHAVSLSSLLGCTSYRYAVLSRDAALNTATSTDNSFVTSGCVASTTPTIVTSTAVTSTIGGSSNVTENNKTFTVSAPTNATATSSSYIIQIKAVSSTPVLNSLGLPGNSLNSISATVFDVKAIINNTTVLDSFDQPITISYQYSDSEVSGINVSSLKLYHYHNGSWEQLNGCTVDTNTKTITCTTTSFSIFALFGEAAAVNSSSGGSTSGSGGGTTIIYGCTDRTATNYNPNASALGFSGQCHYEQPPTPALADVGINIKPTTFTVISNNSELCTLKLNLTKPIQFGVKNNPNDVKSLQKFLNAYENTNFKIDGIYSKANFDAVVRWQEKFPDEILYPWGLKNGTGYVYVTSLNKIKQIISEACNTDSNKSSNLVIFRSLLKKGSTGPEVRALQVWLNTHGFPVAKSGPGSSKKETASFGVNTYNALIHMQKQYGIKVVNGQTGPETNAVLNAN